MKPAPRIATFIFNVPADFPVMKGRNARFPGPERPGYKKPRLSEPEE
jgi:hypothetical protein